MWRSRVLNGFTVAFVGGLYVVPWACVCVYIHIYVHTHTYTYIYIYIYTHIQRIECSSICYRWVLLSVLEFWGKSFRECPFSCKSPDFGAVAE